ncbi:MAG: hypothetical protein WC069_00200 [Candidatus Shapirobacteria bacterium]
MSEYCIQGRVIVHTKGPTSENMLNHIQSCGVCRRALNNESFHVKSINNCNNLPIHRVADALMIRLGLKKSP